MANAILGWGNLIDRAALSGGPTVPTLPLSHAQERTLGRVVRFVNSDPANTWIDIDLRESELVRLVGLINHNAALSDKYRVIASRTPDFSTLAYDSGEQDVWPRVYSSLSLAWEESNFWSGRYRKRDIEGQVWKLMHILPKARYARYWRIQIIGGNGGNPYFQFGRAFISSAWQPVRNITAAGFGIGVKTTTEIQELLSGDKVFDRRKPRLAARFVTANMSDDEKATAFDIMLRSGLDGEVFYSVDPSDTKNAMRNQIYGTLRELNEIEWPYVNGHRVPWAVEGV